MTQYRVDPKESKIELEGSSSVHPLHGEARSLTGTIELELGSDGKPDLGKPHVAKLSVPAEQITWGGSMYDRETRRRLDVKTYPNIDVVVENAEPNGSGYDVKVKMTLRGKTAELDAQASVDVDAQRLVVEGKRTIDIRDFGMDPPKVLMLKVDPQVKVQARVVAVAQG